MAAARARVLYLATSSDRVRVGILNQLMALNDIVGRFADS